MIKDIQPTSFRLRKEVIEKLEKIRQWHKKDIQGSIISEYPFTKTMVVEGLIETTYFQMVQDGQIKE